MDGLNVKVKECYAHFEHTALDVTTIDSDIIRVCSEAIAYKTAAVCVPPCYLGYAKKLLGKEKIKLSTVVGYNSGFGSLKSKLFECKDAIAAGAKELNIYLNLCDVKTQRFEKISRDIANIKKACRNIIVKIIIETDVLFPDEQVAVATIAQAAKVDYLCVAAQSFERVAEDLARLKPVIGRGIKLMVVCGSLTAENVKFLMENGVDRISEGYAINALAELRHQSKSVNKQGKHTTLSFTTPQKIEEELSDDDMLLKAVEKAKEAFDAMPDELITETEGETTADCHPNADIIEPNNEPKEFMHDLECELEEVENQTICV